MTSLSCLGHWTSGPKKASAASAKFAKKADAGALQRRATLPLCAKAAPVVPKLLLMVRCSTDSVKRIILRTDQPVK